MSLFHKRVLVTGASGFIGSYLCKALSDEHSEIVGLARNVDKCNRDLAVYHAVDISNRLQIRKLVADFQPEIVVHLAAEKNRSIELADYRRGYEVNLFGSINLIEACQELPNLTKFVFLGSCEEYGNLQVPFHESHRELPVTAYGATKLSVTQLLQTLAKAHHFPAVILRPSIVYGPRQNDDMFLPALIKALISGEKFGMSQGEQTRDFLYIDDLLAAILMACTAPNVNGKVINISSAFPTRIDAIAKKVASLIGGDVEKLINFGAKGYRPGESMKYYANNSRAHELLGWKPNIVLDEGLQRTVDFFQ